MKKTIFAVSLLIITVIVLSFPVISYVETSINEDVLVIIDAGHGEPDGGAVANDGTKESELNLSVAKKIYTILSDKGIKCVMTRTDDNGLGNNGKTIHQKKVYDTRSRVLIAEKYSKAILLSIHMNTYPSDSVSGIQVFYKNNNENSKDIADEMQKLFNLRLQPSKSKSSKPIPSNIYLFKNTSNNSVLVECGFLTNAEDLSNLKNEQYQLEIAKIISETLIYKTYGG